MEVKIKDVDKDKLVEVLHEQYFKAMKEHDTVFEKYGSYEKVYKSKKGAAEASKLVGKMDAIEDICIALGIELKIRDFYTKKGEVK